MIRIDHISFEFTAPDERFAQELYADWDGFCLHCFTRVAEECLAPYDDHEVLLELERLDLDIGSIPEEDFYDEFPLRLRETLLKALPPQETLSGRDGTERNSMSRMDNLLYYLEHGHPVPEWTDRDFDPQAETEWMAGQSGAFHTTCMDKLSLICLRKEHALRRLLWQTDNGKLTSGIYATVLAMTSAGIQEKRRFLALLLEEKPEIPVEFVHSTRGDGELRGMADLLDNPIVGSIIRTETAEHAEVDLPPYWHYLYGWLINYYPYNGIAMFGGKSGFIRHLHLRLLTYIRRRNHSFYLSKEGLTESFLLEVFGSTYYMDVLNAIYHLQPHNADGTPVYDGYLNMELYRIFIRLSLLRRAYMTERDDDGILVEKQGTYKTKIDTVEWRRLAETLPANGSSGDDGLRAGHIARLLSAPFISRTDLQQSLIRMMDNRPDELQEWIEQEADKDDISKLGGVSDGMIAGHWAECLAATAGFAHSGTFRRLVAWLRRWIPASELATILFLYVKEPGWRTFTPERMETFFFSRVTAPLSFGTLTDGNLTESMRKVLFRQYLRRQPEKLTTFIRESVSRNTLPLDRWIEWTEPSDWLCLAASLSLAKAELLLQMADGLSLTENERKRAWAAYMSYSDTGTWAYDTPQKTIRDFIRTLPSLQYVEAEAKEEAVRKLKKNLKLAEEETPVSEDIPEILPAGNAGLCLLAPWLVRLFSMLGYLDGDKRTFKDTASKIRAVFLLQYTVYGEEREYREPELAFNRLLTALPGNVPLPKRLPMTEEERETADGMVTGVKNNWPKMDGTSVAGFRRSFIARDGMLEQEDARWLLTVEDRAYDILLDTVPWGFRQIRLPWLKKHIQVRWHERQVF